MKTASAIFGIMLLLISLGAYSSQCAYDSKTLEKTCPPTGVVLQKNLGQCQQLTGDKNYDIYRCKKGKQHYMYQCGKKGNKGIWQKTQSDTYRCCSTNKEIGC